MMDLWQDRRKERRAAAQPLAVRMRPRTLEEFAGQQHFLGPGKLLRRMLESGRLTSVIFWGPPGTGKTTLADVIAQHTGSHFERANAAMIGVKEIREILAGARARLEDHSQRTILFLDEIHRFSRNQQDVLLSDVESGIITLIGATTENPYFAINSALVSRSTLFRFEPLSEEEVIALLRRALADTERGFGSLPITVDADALALWATKSDGDARRALNALEVAVESLQAERGQPGDGAAAAASPQSGSYSRSASAIDADSEVPSDEEPDAQGHQNRPLHIILAVAEQSIQAKALVYDGTGDEHYDVVSAFIKSMKGSDPDAAIYWLARMLEAGEDPRFIARRIAILASEDIGNADPLALPLAAAAFDVVEKIGLPEAQLTLAQAAIYMACAPKSNACLKAISAARSDVREGRTIPVPMHLRDAHYRAAKLLGHGENYQYPHNSASGYVDQEYLGVDRVYYEPSERGREADFREQLQKLRGARGAAEPQPEPSANRYESREPRPSRAAE